MSQSLFPSQFGFPLAFTLTQPVIAEMPNHNLSINLN